MAGSSIYLLALLAVTVQLFYCSISADGTSSNGNNNGNCITKDSAAFAVLKRTLPGLSKLGNSEVNGNKNGNCGGRCTHVKSGNSNGNNNTEGRNGNINGNCYGLCKGVQSGNGNGNGNNKAGVNTGNNNGNCIGDCRKFVAGSYTNKNDRGNCVGDCGPGATDNIKGQAAAVITRAVFG